MTLHQDDPYEEPKDAELVADTTKQTVPEIVHCKQSYSLITYRSFTQLCTLAIILMLEAAGLLG